MCTQTENQRDNHQYMNMMKQRKDQRKKHKQGRNKLMSDMIRRSHNKRSMKGYINGCGCWCKSNSIYCFLLSTLMTILIFKVTPIQGKPVRCSVDSISWRNKSTGIIVACTKCEQCPPSQEYSIPCGETVDIGTDARCLPCPTGMYSDKFDTKRCKHCTICTNKVVNQSCTGSQNAICGACLDGFERDPHIFSCVPKETSEPPSLHVPTIGSTTRKVDTNTPSTTTHGRNSTAQPTETSTVVPPSTRAPEKSTTSGGHDSLNLTAIVPVGIMAFVLIVILVLATVYFVCRDKHNAKSQCVRYFPKNDSSKEPIIQITTGNSKEQLLKDFIHSSTSYAAVDDVCKYLSGVVNGTYDFVRVAVKWEFSKADIVALKGQAHAHNSCPGRTLIDKLITLKCEITVRAFAESIKDINRDAYNILMKHCTVPGDVKQNVNDNQKKKSCKSGHASQQLDNDQQQGLLNGEGSEHVRESTA